ncbi:MAG: cell wall metabolism sensor histidine kinase WalK [Tissierellia bacterium]|nr:cell wall metabolism sensor histidine kinase WalK [Tissierellia bacterium]
MFKSIKLRFVTIYFVLVLGIMAIVGVFIIKKLETTQIEDIGAKNIESIRTISESSEIISNSDWLEESEKVQTTLDESRLGSNEQWFMIYNEDMPIIIASNISTREAIKDKNALEYKGLDPMMIINGFNGEMGKNLVESREDESKVIHITYPVENGEGDIQGVIYTIVALDNVYNMLNSAKIILSNATLIALVTTVILGFALASSITGPISDVTKQAEEMALGNFHQRVDVKSDDEIGKLGSMFNYLTEELDHTIASMDVERSKLNTIFNYMAEGVIAIDSSNRLIHANSIAKELLQLSDIDIKIGSTQNLSKLNINELDYNKISTLEGTASIELNDRFYNIKYAPYLDDYGHASGIIIVFQDITKEHKLDDMRKEFVANVSHELKTPITTIKTYTETLLDSDIDEELSKTFLKTINRESDRMSIIVKDLLDLSNIDYKYTNWEYDEVNLNALIKQTLASLELIRNEKNQSVEFKSYKEDTIIFSDRNALERIFMNIIGNAMKYTEEKGNISIEMMEFKNTVQIAVKDNGIGIPYKDQKRIFERFYRVEKGRSRKEGGTGLGLSIARGLVEELGGTIRLKSTPNIGTEITITLPKMNEGVVR